MKATVSQKGQITIPKSCRDQLGIKTGAILEFQAINGTLVGRRVQMPDGIHKWRGKGRLPGGARNVDDYLSIAVGRFVHRVGESSRPFRHEKQKRNACGGSLRRRMFFSALHFLFGFQSGNGSEGLRGDWENIERSLFFQQVLSFRVYWRKADTILSREIPKPPLPKNSQNFVKIKALNSALMTFLAAAVVSLSPARAVVTFDWAAVGDVGNAADPLNSVSVPGIGSVSTTYQIATKEVNMIQYTEFLNAVDPTGANSLALYNIVGGHPKCTTSGHFKVHHFWT